MTDLFKELEELIPPPGHFLLVENVDGERLGTTSTIQGRRLDMFKEPEVAKGVYEMYSLSWTNAVHLLNEAKLLFQHDRFARTVALGISAWEELGKSQIAADYYTGLLPEQTYNSAFRDHALKTSYLVRTMGIGEGVSEPGLVLSPVIGKRLEKIRQAALYVSESNDPKTTFNREAADFVLRRVYEHKEYIEYAEEFNGRIGSKALFK